MCNPKQQRVPFGNDNKKSKGKGLVEARPFRFWRLQRFMNLKCLNAVGKISFSCIQRRRTCRQLLLA